MFLDAHEIPLEFYRAVLEKGTWTSLTNSQGLSISYHSSVHIVTTKVYESSKRICYLTPY